MQYNIVNMSAVIKLHRRASSYSISTVDLLIAPPPHSPAVTDSASKAGRAVQSISFCRQITFASDSLRDLGNGIDVNNPEVTSQHKINYTAYVIYTVASGRGQEQRSQSF